MQAGGAAARREAIDVARILALVLVVSGHLLLAVVDRPDGELRGANLLALHPGWAWIAALAPMPVFFAAAGWANATATPATAGPRLRRLVGLGAVVVGGWSAAVVGMVLVTGDPGIVGDGARISTQPLWFVAAYVPFAAAGALLARLAAERAVPAIACCLAALDIARFGLGAPDWIGWPGFFLAWGVPWIAGAWWRARRQLPDWNERRRGAVLALLASAAGVVLVRYAGYDPALIDAVKSARSNTNPPTLHTAVAGLAQVGVLLVVAGGLDRLGRRFPSLWSRAGEAAVGVYVWHLTALSLCVAVIAAGLPAPERLTVAWWLTRPAWWLAVMAVTGALVALTELVRTRLPARGAASHRDWVTVTGVVVASAAGAYVGLEGPGTAGRAVVCTSLFVGAWLLLPRGVADVTRDGREPIHRA